MSTSSTSSTSSSSLAPRPTTRDESYQVASVLDHKIQSIISSIPTAESRAYFMSSNLRLACILVAHGITQEEYSACRSEKYLTSLREFYFKERAQAAQNSNKILLERVVAKASGSGAEPLMSVSARIRALNLELEGTPDTGSAQHLREHINALSKLIDLEETMLKDGNSAEIIGIFAEVADQSYHSITHSTVSVSSTSSSSSSSSS